LIGVSRSGSPLKNQQGVAPASFVVCHSLQHNDKDTGTNQTEKRHLKGLPSWGLGEENDTPRTITKTFAVMAAARSLGYLNMNGKFFLPMRCSDQKFTAVKQLAPSLM
jgi:hypothetical protein